MTIRDTIKLIYSRVEGKGNTLSSYRDTLEPFCKVFGERECPSITPLEVRDYLQSLKVSEGTLFLRFSHIRALFNAALHFEKISKNGDAMLFPNPCDALKNDFRRPKLNGKLYNSEKHEKVQGIRDSLKDHHRLIFDLGTRGGLRISEILNLKVDDLVIQNKAHVCVIAHPKSGADQEYQPIPKDLFEALQEHGRNRTGRLFPHTRQAIWSILHRRGVKPHDLRRCAATRAMEKGMDLETIRGLLRHSSIRTTERYIGRLSVQRLAEKLEGM